MKKHAAIWGTIALFSIVAYAGVVEIIQSSTTEAVALTRDDVVGSEVIVVNAGDSTGVNRYRVALTDTSALDPETYAVEFTPSETRNRVSGIWYSRTVKGERETIHDLVQANWLVVPPTMTNIWHDQGTDDAVDDAFVDTLYSIDSIAVDTAGTGYDSGPSVTISGPGGPDITATATLGMGVANSNIIVGPDSERPTRVVSASADEGATTGQITDVVLAGSGCYNYWVFDPRGNEAPIVVEFSEPPSGGTRATGTIDWAKLGAGPISQFYLYPAGSGYTTAPTIELRDEGSGSGFVGSFTVNDDGTLGSNDGDATIADGGNCYANPKQGHGYNEWSESLPEHFVKADLVGGDGTGATISRIGVNSVNITAVKSVTITDPGSGYIEPPTVTFKVGDCANNNPNDCKTAWMMSWRDNENAGVHATAVASLGSGTAIEPEPEPEPEPELEPEATTGSVTHIELDLPGCYNPDSATPTVSLSTPDETNGVQATASLTFAAGAGPLTAIRLNRGTSPSYANADLPEIDLSNTGNGYGARPRVDTVSETDGRLDRDVSLEGGDCYATVSGIRLWQLQESERRSHIQRELHSDGNARRWNRRRWRECRVRHGWHCNPQYHHGNHDHGTRFWLHHGPDDHVLGWHWATRYRP